jgi:putative acetyltransferase
VTPAVSFRTATSADADQILAVVADAFRNEEDVALVETVWALPGHLQSLELVAVIETRIVGHVLWSLGTIGATPVPGLAPLAVAPGHQGIGIGSALVNRSVALADEAGYPMAIVTGRPSYYARFGFTPASTFRVGPTNPQDFPDLDAFMAKRLGGRATPRGTFTYAWQ